MSDCPGCGKKFKRECDLNRHKNRRVPCVQAVPQPPVQAAPEPIVPPVHQQRTLEQRVQHLEQSLAQVLKSFDEIVNEVKQACRDTGPGDRGPLKYVVIVNDLGDLGMQLISGTKDGNHTKLSDIIAHEGGPMQL